MLSTVPSMVRQLAFARRWNPCQSARAERERTWMLRNTRLVSDGFTPMRPQGTANRTFAASFQRPNHGTGWDSVMNVR